MPKWKVFILKLHQIFEAKNKPVLDGKIIQIPDVVLIPKYN